MAMSTAITRPPRGDGRVALLEAAIRVGAQHGLRGLTIRSVAAEAGVSHGLVRHHFGSRQQLVDEALEHAARMSMSTGDLEPGTGDPADFSRALEDIVGADSVIVNPALATTNFSLSSDAIVVPGPAVPYDSLQALVIADNIEAFVLKQPLDAAFIGRAPVLSPSQAEDWPIGVDRVPPGGLGRFVFFAFPLRLLGGTPPGAPDPSPDFNYGQKTVRRVLYRFGHGAAP